MNMNTSMSFNTSEPLWNKRASSETTSEPSWSRRCSTETIFSIQDRETDLLRDTSDTEWSDSDALRVEYEPPSEPERDHDGPLAGDTTEHSDNEIISTKVIEVVVRDDLELADSEQTATGDSDSEIDYHDYWHCAQCRAHNNNPLYRYCEKCFKVRKNFFPPRPKPKHKPETTRLDGETIPRTLSQDSGVESAINSQELSQEPGQDLADGPTVRATDSETRLSVSNRNPKRRGESLDRHARKRLRVERSGSESDSLSGPERTSGVGPATKMTADPALTVADPALTDAACGSERALTDAAYGSGRALTYAARGSGRALGEGEAEAEGEGLCIVCCAAPKSGVFVHGRIAHICCCYRCARRVWARAGRCPVCNCKVSNVLRAVVM